MPETSFLRAAYTNPVANRLIKNKTLTWWQPSVAGMVIAVVLGWLRWDAIQTNLDAALKQTDIAGYVSILLVTSAPLLGSFVAVVTTSRLLDDSESYLLIKLSGQTPQKIVFGLVTGTLQKLRFYLALAVAALPLTAFSSALVWTSIRILNVTSFMVNIVQVVFGRALRSTIILTCGVFILFFVAILLGIATRALIKSRGTAVVTAGITVVIYAAACIFSGLHIARMLPDAFALSLLPVVVPVPALYFLIERHL